MFSWGGRCLFFFFVGTLSFGIGVVGICAGVYTILNMLFNVYVLRTNKEYHDQVEKDTVEMRERAEKNQKSPAKKKSNEPTVTAKVPTVVGDVEVTMGVNDMAKAAGAVSQIGVANAGTANATGGLDSDPSWKKYYDEGTKSHYYYNEKTKETRWA